MLKALRPLPDNYTGILRPLTDNYTGVLSNCLVNMVFQCKMETESFVLAEGITTKGFSGLLPVSLTQLL